jgi:hypothetical protein
MDDVTENIIYFCISIEGGGWLTVRALPFIDV